jgi:hypothetical protein
MSYSASVAGMVPHPVHWNLPPQSPVWQWPVPALLNTQPVRPQNRPFQLFGTVIVTLCPAGSTQPVAASGALVSGEAATQMVWLTWLTKVTRRSVPVADGADDDEAGGWADGVGAWVVRVGVGRAGEADVAAERLVAGARVIVIALALVAEAAGAGPSAAVVAGGTAEQAAAITAVATAAAASASRAGQRLRACLPSLIRVSLVLVTLVLVLVLLSWWRFQIGDRRGLGPITKISGRMPGSFRYPPAPAPVS